MLSKENFDKLNENHLYKREPSKKYCISDDLYWCKNWIFKVKKYRDGRAVMKDTYYGDSMDSLTFEVTDENINDFEFIFDFREVEKVHKDDVCNYKDEDIFIVALGSGGWTYGKRYYKKKEINKSKKLQIENLEYEISKLETKLRYKKEELKRVLEGF